MSKSDIKDISYQDTICYKVFKQFKRFGNFIKSIQIVGPLKKFINKISENKIISLVIFLFVISFLFMCTVGEIGMVKTMDDKDEVVWYSFIFIFIYFSAFSISIGGACAICKYYYDLKESLLIKLILFFGFVENAISGTIYLFVLLNENSFEKFHFFLPAIISGIYFGIIITFFILLGIYKFLSLCYLECFKKPYQAFKNARKNVKTNISNV